MSIGGIYISRIVCMCICFKYELVITKRCRHIINEWSRLFCRNRIKPSNTIDQRSLLLPRWRWEQ